MSVDRLLEIRKKKGLHLHLGPGQIPADDPSNPHHYVHTNNGSEPKSPVDPGSSDVELQIELYKPINALIEEIEKATAFLDVLRARDAKASDEKARRRIYNEMNEVVNRAMMLSRDVKDALLEIKQLNQEFDSNELNQSSARSQIRNNLYNTTCLKLQRAAEQFTDSRDAYRAAVQERMARQIQIVDPTKTDEEILRLIDDGHADKIITKALASDNLREVVQDLKWRRDELAWLQRNVESLYMMFQELYHLIDLQGESINVIEQHVARSLDYVVQAEANLQDVRQKSHKTGHRCLCGLLFMMLVVAILVLTPILITSTTGGKVYT